MCKYFCTGYIDFTLKDKSFLDYTNLFSSNSTISIPIKSFVISCMLPSFRKESFNKERQDDGSLVKSITLSENDPVRLIAVFLSDSNIWYCSFSQR